MEHNVREHGFALASGVMGPEEIRDMLDALGPAGGAGGRGILGLPAFAAFARSTRVLDLVRSSSRRPRSRAGDLF